MSSYVLFSISSSLLFFFMFPPPLSSTLFPTRRSSDLAPLAASFSLATLASLLVALTVTPAAAWLLLRRTEPRSEEHTSELQSRFDLVCRLLLEKKKKQHSSV